MQLGTLHVYCEKPLSPRYRRSALACATWPLNIKRSPRKWATRVIAWKVNRNACANLIWSWAPSARSSETHIVGQTAPTAASARVRRRCRSPRACSALGIHGSAPRRIEIIIPTYTRTNGTAGTISATAPLGNMGLPCAGRHLLGAQGESSRQHGSGGDARGLEASVIRREAVCAGTFPRAATCRRSKCIGTKD